MPTTNPRYANGHRRRQLRARILREEDLCWLCNEPVDKTLGLQPGVHSERCQHPDCAGCVPHPLSPEVDEIIPVSLGGDPLDRSNSRLSHRTCNRRRSNGQPRVSEPLKRSRDWTANS